MNKLCIYYCIAYLLHILLFECRATEQAVGKSKSVPPSLETILHDNLTDSVINFISFSLEHETGFVVTFVFSFRKSVNLMISESQVSMLHATCLKFRFSQ